MTSDQQSSAEQVGDLTSVATTYKEVPDELQNLQSFVTQGKLAGFSAPDGLLCIDDDCAKRRQDMPDKYKCKVCTCAGKNGKDSPCKVKINVEASHSGLAVVAFEDLQNVAAAFAGVDATMVSFTLEDADKIGMSVWLEDSAEAAALAAKVIEDIEKGPKSTLSISIAKAIEDQNKDGIKVSSVETSASGASESKYENDKGPVQSDGRGGGNDKSNSVTDTDGGGDGGGNSGTIIGAVIGVVVALAMGGFWLMWVRKNKNRGSPMGGADSDFAIGVLESGSGRETIQMTETRGKRVSMANPLNGEVAAAAQGGGEDNISELDPDMKRAGWASAVDDEGDVYFYNHKQGVSTYDMPVYKGGAWVVPSDDEEEDEDDDDDGEEEVEEVNKGGAGQPEPRTAKKKPTLLVSNTQKFNANSNRVKANKSMSMAVQKKKQRSLGAGKQPGNRNKINKRSQSLAVSAMKNPTSASRWKRKKRMLSQPAIPIVNEEEEEEGEEEPLVLSAAMKKSGWKAAIDDDGDEYFYNHERGESTYELPVLKEGAFVAPSDDEDEDED
jgi:hypothetical protein